MKELKKYEHIINGTTAINESRPNLDGTLWSRDIAGFTAAMREDGIKEFTISQSSTLLLDLLACFKEQGVVVQDIVKVKSTMLDFNTGEHEEIPAILMKVM